MNKYLEKIAISEDSKDTWKTLGKQMVGGIAGSTIGGIAGAGATLVGHALAPHSIAPALFPTVGALAGSIAGNYLGTKHHIKTIKDRYKDRVKQAALQELINSNVDFDTAVEEISKA